MDTKSRSKVLLDIGAHHGESLAYALNPRFGFDRIFTFEPSPSCWPELSKFRDPRLSIQRIGLSSQQGTLPLYGGGSVGASLFPDKEGVDRSIVELVAIESLSTWFARWISKSDEVFVKINCEGGELEIIQALLDPAVAEQIGGLFFTPDLLKVVSLKNRFEELMEELAGAPFPIVMRNERHTSRQFISWLKSTGTNHSIIPRALFALGFRQPKYFVFRLKASELLPQRLVRPLFSMLGRTAWHIRCSRLRNWITATRRENRPPS